MLKLLPIEDFNNGVLFILLLHKYSFTFKQILLLKHARKNIQTSHLTHQYSPRDGADNHFWRILYPSPTHTFLHLHVSAAALWRWGWFHNFYSISILLPLILFFVYMFHLRHSGDGADCIIFTLSLSFFHYLPFLSNLYKTEYRIWTEYITRFNKNNKENTSLLIFSRLNKFNFIFFSGNFI